MLVTWQVTSYRIFNYYIIGFRFFVTKLIFSFIKIYIIDIIYYYLT